MGSPRLPQSPDSFKKLLLEQQAAAPQSLAAAPITMPTTPITTTTAVAHDHVTGPRVAPTMVPPEWHPPWYPRNDHVTAPRVDADSPFAHLTQPQALMAVQASAQLPLVVIAANELVSKAGHPPENAVRFVQHFAKYGAEQLALVDAAAAAGRSDLNRSQEGRHRTSVSERTPHWWVHTPSPARLDSERVPRVFQVGAC